MDEALRGYADLHLHQFADLAFGGDVIWGSSAGAEAEALASCVPSHGEHGRRDWVGNGARVLLGHASWRQLLGHETNGHPDFPEWPYWNDYTHQVAHEKMLKRAVDGGLRLAVVLAVHNEMVCRLRNRLQLTMDDETAVARQLAAAHEFEKHIDAQSGGPGTGWYRIVHTPAEAREVIRSGRLAVVLGVEVDTIFGALRPDDLSADDLSAAVERYYRAGVRHIIPIHFRDNAFGGAAFAQPVHWSRNSGPVSAANPVPSLPLYRMSTTDRSDQGYRLRGGHCNTQGLTALGRQLIRELARRNMILDVDHMSVGTRTDALAVAVDEGCAVIAGHAEFQELSRTEKRSERQLQPAEIRLLSDAGGVAAPLLRQNTMSRDVAASIPGFATAVRHSMAESGSAWCGFGSDANGFAGLLRPGTPLQYPFTSALDGSAMEASVVGRRVLDLERDGVAHVGMIPDLIAALATTGHQPVVDALMTSAAGYLDLWERSSRRGRDEGDVHPEAPTRRPSS